MEGTIQTLHLNMLGGLKKEPALMAKQYDTNSRLARLKLFVSDQPYQLPSDCTMYLYVRKPDKKVVFSECMKEGENAVLAPLTEQMLAIDGVAVCELHIQTIDGSVKSQSFYLRIEPAVMDMDAIESSDEFNVFASTLAEMQSKKQELDAGIDMLRNLTGEELEVQLTNSQKYPFNNSVKTIALGQSRNNLNYSIEVEVVEYIGGEVGDIAITAKQLNGFKIKYNGSATKVTLILRIKGGM